MLTFNDPNNGVSAPSVKGVSAPGVNGVANAGVKGVSAPGNAYYVSLYMSVDPATHDKGSATIHLKNMIKSLKARHGMEVFRAVREDFSRIESFLKTERRSFFKKSVLVISSTGSGFWKVYHLSVPIKNDMVIDTAPYITPLAGIVDNFKKYGVALVDRELARIFLVHMGRVAEYDEVRSEGIQGRHKKGGWFALSQDHYARHIERQVAMHLKEAMGRLREFLASEKVDTLMLGGSAEAVATFKDMLPTEIRSMVRGVFDSGMCVTADELMRKVEPLVSSFEAHRQDEEVRRLVSAAPKSGLAAVGLDDVLTAVHQGRVRKLMLVKDFNNNSKTPGYGCGNCGFKTTTEAAGGCPYCGAAMQRMDYAVEDAVHLSIEQGAVVETVYAGNRELTEKGGIGAFLHF